MMIWRSIVEEIHEVWPDFPTINPVLGGLAAPVALRHAQGRINRVSVVKFLPALDCADGLYSHGLRIDFWDRGLEVGAWAHGVGNAALQMTTDPDPQELEDLLGWAARRYGLLR
jgi:hypothetical protein